ncbi:MAG: threonylcarbamoyl-AMP synthase [Bacteriodetes bacterium]|nr:threonylcarbamoyl-AMP synthase [Bacteroidota bacterium]
MNTLLLDGINQPIYAIKKAVKLLQAGELVAFPTETVYGLGAGVFNVNQIQKIFSSKGRPSDNPLIVHIAYIDEVYSVASEVPDEYHVLATHFFPGPLTVVLPKKSAVPDIVSAGLPSVAVRMPHHQRALDLIKAVGTPLVAPSANISGKPSPTTAAHVMEDFDGKIAAIIDGGACKIGIESTVISLLDVKKPVILRPGMITRSELELVLGITIHVADDKTTHHSPGMKYRHYSPNAVVYLTEDIESLPPDMASALILTSQTLLIDGTFYRELSPQTLYSEFRRADMLGITEIYIHLTPDIESNVGLMNRIMKAVSRV